MGGHIISVPSGYQAGIPELALTLEMSGLALCSDTVAIVGSITIAIRTNNGLLVVEASSSCSLARIVYGLSGLRGIGVGFEKTTEFKIKFFGNHELDWDMPDLVELEPGEPINGESYTYLWGQMRWRFSTTKKHYLYLLSLAECLV
ncbi:hypothetical protein GIB67_031675 [Kingdonia uniflora]|uniref:Uncharacterized protein n=1 Tax=Kingdonia uniflora TaxID=39325 RepID=A0A7J7NKH2_9MAGN|nr:hypothetical protein GIB67_031675 [Kingdonia uniflora]